MSTIEVRDYPFESEKLDAHPLYEQLRREEPISRVHSRHGDEAWLVTRHEDIRAVLADPRITRAAAATNLDEPHMRPFRGGSSPTFVLANDGAKHARLKRLAMKAFNKAYIQSQSDRIEALANDHVDRMLAAGPPADLVADFASPIAITILCEMLGLPLDRTHTFINWAEAFIAIDGMQPEEVVAQLGESKAYFGELVAQRREVPSNDLISALAGVRVDDDEYSHDEAVAMAMFILIAGYVATSAQLPKFIYALLTNTDQLAVLRNEPELLPQAIEELMRYVPVGIGPIAARYATEDVEIGEVTIRAGDAVLVVPNSGNRDESVYPDADKLVLHREGPTHLGFGHGAHRCLGAPLARMEMQILVKVLLDRLPGLRFAGSAEDVKWRDELALRTIERMAIAWD